MPKITSPTGLTAKQQRYVAEYLVDLNQKQAAIRAGYSERTSAKIASELMQKPHVRAAIDADQRRIARKLDLQAEDVLREVVHLAMFDPADLIIVKRPADIAKLPEEVRRAIVGWSWDRQGRFTVKLA